MSPRVREDSVHPRLQLGLSRRPLKFTVRCRFFPHLAAPNAPVTFRWKRFGEPPPQIALIFSWVISAFSVHIVEPGFEYFRDAFRGG